MSRKEKGYRSSLAHSVGNGQNTTDIEDDAVDGPKSEIQHGLRRFSKRTCIQFVPTKNDRERCGCGLGKSDHSLLALRHIPSSEITWNPLVNTGTEPTDAYGQIEFSGAGQTSRAKYIRIAHDTDADTVLKNVFEEEWKLKLPKLLISVTGGAKSFVLHPKLKQVLRQGLLKAAKTTGAWIITGGTNTGVMKHVGEAVRGQTVTSHPVMDDDTQLHLIGVATWGIIEHKESLIDNKDTVTYHMTSSMASSGACLDNNHTHFILVDNGSQGQYGVEIPFRASLENAISKRKMSSETKHGIPVVLLVLEGGPNTIRTVLESVTRSPAVPVVIAEGSGRAADILAFAHRFIVENEGPEITELQDLVEHRQLLQKIELAYPGESEESVLDIYKNVLKCVGNKRFITIFRVDEEGIDIDKAILKALLKAEHASVADQLSLALVWNRADIAMSEIFIESHRWKMEDLEAAMMDALKNDRVEFVSLLLENGVGMGRFLTKERLFTLYKERSKISVAFQEMIGDSKLRTFTLQDIDCVIDKMLGGSRTGQLAMGFDESILRFTLHMESESQHPFDDLFLWAVLCNMHKMAVFMWERGGNNLACALVGAKLYMEMASRLEGDELRGDVYEQITANAKEFKDVALSLLDECSRANEVATQKLLTYHLADWCGHTCLSLAIMTEHQEFVAHASCQSLLTEIWMGAMRNLYLPSLKVILGIMVPPTIYFLDFKTKRELSLLPVTFTEHQTEMDGNDSSCSSEQGEEIFGEKRKKEKVVKKSTYERKVEARSTFYGKSIDCHVKTLSAGRKLLEFYRAPITKFWANVIAYLMFLMLFSYVIVVTERSYPLIAEIVLIVFVCSLCTEEIRQICQSDVSTSNNKFIAWASSKWNICDGLAVVFFFVGLGLRFNEPTAAIGHVVYSLDVMLWIIRLLDIFSVSKHLGPYVVMIGRMTVDMLYFLLIMVVFLLAYGVAQQAILFPKERGSWGLISKIFFRPYFQTYGELFITDPIQLTVNSTTTEFDTPKHDEYSGTIATVIMAFYLLVANILLLNLLIAIFNNTFSEIQANSNQIWKFQRYDLIMEYAQRPVLVPPLIILNHVIELMCCCWNGLCCCRDNRRDRKVLADNRLKLFLDKYEKEELLMFEEHCLYLYLHHKDTLFNATSEERVRVIGNRVDFVASQLDEMARETFNRDTNTNKTVTALTGKVKTLQNNTKTILKLLTSLHGLNPERFGITDSDDEDVRSAKGSDILSYFGTKRAKLSGDRSPSPVRRTAAHAKEAFCTLRSKSVSPPIVPESKRRRRSEGSPSTSPVVPLGDVLPRATRSPSKYTAIRKPKRSHDIDEADFAHNIKSTRSPYPMTTIERYSVNEQELDWENLMPWYSPPCYTADAIIAASTDPDLHSISADDVKISFNEFDGNINRKSHTGRYDVINGLPRNPAGRTGLVGRGLLEHWGPNRIAWYIITRWRKKDDGDIESRGKRKVLEFMAWKTGTNQKWSLPEEKQVNVPEKSDVEGVVLEVVSDSFKKQFIDNITLAMSDSLKQERYHKEKLIREQLFQQGNEVYRGYLDDERNTDNAWMEIVVTNFHDDTGEILNSISFTETNDAYSMAWFMVSGHIDLPENHVTMLGKVARIHKSYF